MRNFSEICAPITKCMKKGILKWTTTTMNSFEDLMKKVTKRLVLTLPNFNKVFQVDYDASGSIPKLTLFWSGEHLSVWIDVRIFHGLERFYRKFMRNFSEICAPITRCMKKGIFKWTTTTMNSFEDLKEKVTERLVLTLLYFNKVFQVDCDASGSTIGAILSQGGRTIAFFSEKLNDVDTKYSIYDQEFYAIVQALKKWRH
jgi:hypothetical protein